MIGVIERVFGIRAAKKRAYTDSELQSFARRLVPKDLKRRKVQLQRAGLCQKSVHSQSIGRVPSNEH
jgi:hypothetical protein